MVEKLTELGVYTIAWIETQRTERKTINPEKIKAWTIAAMKQSHRYFLPKLEYYKSLQSFLTSDTSQFKWVASLQSHVFDPPAISQNSSISIIIGPEGDLTPEEYQMIAQHQIQAVSLGDHILRTETAAIASLLKAQFFASQS